jgi:hypothetical protein
MRTVIIRICISTSLIFSLSILSSCGDSDSPAAAVDQDTGTPAAAVDQNTGTPAAAVTRPDAYAPMLVIPKKLPDDPGMQMMVMMANNTVMPSASEVNVPLYPGAQVMSAMGAMKMTANGVEETTWPSMSLLSADETAEIAAFYQKQLTGWRYKEFFGMHSFWNGDEDSNPMDITGQFSLVSITPVPETDTLRAVWPETRTRIDLRYEPVVN